MKNSGKNTETWWKIEEQTMKHNEQKRKKQETMMKKSEKKQWHMMKKRGKTQGSMMKNRVTTMKNDET